MAAAMVLSAAGCQGISDLVTGKTTTEEGLVDDKGKKLTPDEQKTKIDETLDALMTDLDMSVWQGEYNKVESVLDEMGEKKIDPSVLENHLETIVDAWTSVTGEDPFVTTTYLAKLTDLKGHFTENADGGFDYAEADDLQITINSGGKTITATFAAKVSDTVITISQGEYGSKNESGEWTERYENIAKAYVPTEAVLGLLVDGSTLASLSIHLNYQDVNGDGWMSEEDKVDLGYTLVVGAYTMELERANYATDNATVSAKILRDKNLVVGVSAKAAFKVDVKEEFVPVSAEVKVDVEGKIQVMGTVPSYQALETASDNIEKAIEANNYDAFCTYLADVEKAYGLGVYYDGKNTLQATLGFEPIKYEDAPAEDYNGDGVIDDRDKLAGFGANPVIRFQDGTSYTIEEYFTEERFGGTVQKVTDWAVAILEALGINEKGQPVAQ